MTVTHTAHGVACCHPDCLLISLVGTKFFPRSLSPRMLMSSLHFHCLCEQQQHQQQQQQQQQQQHLSSGGGPCSHF